MATVIIFGNEKGGTGKSTLAVHVAVALARQGLNVAAIDGDINQGSFTKYLANRSSFVSSTSQAALPSPTFISHEWDSMSESELARHLTNSSADVVIVDTPGALTPLSKTLHSFADLVVTPLNDSLVDLDVLADVDPDTGEIRKPSHYAERLWKARQTRAARDGGSISWIVLRNRLSALDAHNKRVMADILDKLAARIGFDVGPGFGERVIFRELFLQGLTLSDFEDRESGLAWTLSHVAARQELRDLLALLAEGLSRDLAASDFEPG
ncbi:MAG: AAA family ATPase [Rhodospirillaceae bacterium]|jgi:chromosome partitioning protein|nr:AAA family ATPase [Rhodospirillaceae bacterium]MBT5565410.1 AAA family ATPase [Rhodospirillaceae bacterium]MBT6089275.1 AAA family ATPase [Rhodospirillaceae bacterium]MBT7449784.1 AAA family ATPase [Rhodospirillaceae bacterium]